MRYQSQFIVHSHTSPPSFITNVQTQTIPLRNYRSLSTDKNTETSRKVYYDSKGQEWYATIGLEIHAQISSPQKLFSGCRTDWDKEPNTNIFPQDIGIPGTLPVLNPDCIKKAVSTILALSGEVQLKSSFDRKHYFYPDQPLGYQITQHYEPIGLGGQLVLNEQDYASYSGEGKNTRNAPKGRIVRIKQVQLEQDTAKSFHDIVPNKVLIDFNRAGIGLMEIVTEPDLTSGEEAGIFLSKIRDLLQTIKASNAQMEQGSLRCDVNVSVFSPTSDNPRYNQVNTAVRCELKNMNSIKAVVAATEREIKRHIDVIENGPERDNQLVQETRGYNVKDNETFRIRAKEQAQDYRYMPEPDVPEIVLDDAIISRVRAELPELPDQKLERLMTQYGLKLEDAQTMMDVTGCTEFFEKVMRITKNRESSMAVVPWITSELFGYMKFDTSSPSATKVGFEDLKITPAQLASIVDDLKSNKLTSAMAKKVLQKIVLEQNKGLASEIAQQNGWTVISDDSEDLRKMCEKLISNNPKEASKFKKGSNRVLGFFVGQVMKETKGQAKPQVVSRIFTELLSK
ncbi:hypothetical protein H4219_003318 [Mycoemilia scoparia]|uniref:Glutamyl-tRNA(Gln) amidotransferase subunit B, mitochondrial n=1 Tax=Mycoemilia scoparia TaxID=417184 RepID=A0A9W8A4H7_9FUNG|nr:hypothetical protein H4219_003318 [Mycoemilia scoparia]